MRLADPRARKACRLRSEAGKRAERFSRASSVRAFSLRRTSANAFSRETDVVSNWALDARGASELERRPVSRHERPRPRIGQTQSATARLPATTYDRSG